MAKMSKLMEETTRRYQMHSASRQEKQRHLENLEKGSGGDWRKVDSPARVLNRLAELGETAIASEVMASVETKADGATAVPVLNPLERIFLRDDMLGIDFLYFGARVAKAVGRIVIKDSGRVLGYGTGFMVSPSLLMTNNHVLEMASSAQSSIVQFDYYETFAGVQKTTIEYSLEPSTLFLTDKDLDFTLVAVQATNGQGTNLRERGWCQLIAKSGKAVVGETVNIIQHPLGEFQKIALRENKIVDVIESFLHYVTDTNPGSSGSPVLNDQWQLAALHHSGVPKKDAQGNILLRDGRIWNGQDDQADLIDWEANEGVRISSIIQFIERQKRQSRFNARELSLIDEMLTIPPFQDEQIKAILPVNNPQPTSTLNADGTASWTIPLTIRVGLDLSSVSPGSSSPKVPEPQRPVIVSQPEPVPTLDEGELQKALSTLAEAKSKPYYEETKDKQAKKDYYSGINAQATKKTLFKNLSKLVIETHTNEPKYDNARIKFLYPWVDLREDMKLQSIYSGTSLDPEELIRADLEAMARREVYLRNTPVREWSVALEELEAAFPFNCEHVVPQSWFAKKEPMRGDMHHLFSCEPDCNSFRGNTPYYQFSPGEEKFRDNCGNRQQSKFEPVSGKGPVARATLYFLLRYPSLIGDESRELQKNRLNVLVDWHKQNPPTKYELHRNVAIFEIQGNRNPLIDHPNWIDKIDFLQGFGE